MSEEIEDEMLDKAFELLANDRFSEAESVLVLLLEKQPDSTTAYYLLGAIAAKAGRRPQAIAFFNRVLTLDPHHEEALCDLGLMLLQDGQIEKAAGLLLTATQYAPESSAAWNGLGEAHLSAERTVDAEECFGRAIELDPLSAVPVYNLAIAHKAMGRDEDSVLGFHKAIELNPKSIEPWIRLGNLLTAQGKRSAAYDAFNNAIDLDADNCHARIGLATLLFEMGQLNGAEKNIRIALNSDPANKDALCRLGDVLARIGRFEEAIEAYRDALLADPKLAPAYAGIINTKRLTPEDRPLLDSVEGLLNSRSSGPAEQAVLHFAAGKACDDLGRYFDAIQHFDKGNRIEADRLREAGRTLDRDRHAHEVDRIIETFTPDFFARYAHIGSLSELPVLIVGMPRSGTTLVEQIVSAHPEVAAGDELVYWGEVSANISNDASAAFTTVEANALSEGYIALLRSIGPQALRITDKMPQNFLHLGLVHLIFPNARIVHCRRNPIDTCLSIYFTHFGLMRDFAFERSSIVFFYEQYRKITAHWRKVLPSNRFFEIEYEELVKRPEAAIRDLVSFCGLDWNDACLRSERNQRAISTASLWQARQPLYTRSAARHRNYEPWLGVFRSLVLDSEIACNSAPLVECTPESGQA